MAASAMTETIMPPEMLANLSVCRKFSFSCSLFNALISLDTLPRLLRLFVTPMGRMLLVKSLKSGLVSSQKYDGRVVMVPSSKLMLPSLLLL